MKKRLYHHICGMLLPCFAFAAVTGAVSAVLVTAFKLLAELGISLSLSAYAAVREAPIWLPLLILGAAACGLLESLVLSLSHNCRGGGIPTSVAAIRGIVGFRWVAGILLLPISAFLTFLGGLPLGTEGPCVQMGTAVGDGVTSCLSRKKRRGWRRYIMTGGASAGFSIATASPISAIVFSVEELHKHFSPLLLSVAAVAVASAQATTHALASLGIGTVEFFHVPDIAAIPTKLLFAPLLVGIAAGLASILFTHLYHLVDHLMRAVHKRIPSRILLPLLFALTAIVGFFFADTLGTGHALVDALFTPGAAVHLLLLLFLVRAIGMTVSNTSGATGGIFLPTLAFGAIIGAVCADALIALGAIDAELYLLMVITGITAFLGATSRIPLTACIFAIEALGGIHNILSILAGMTVALLIAESSGLEDLTDTVIHAKIRKIKKGKCAVAVEVPLTVTEDAFVVGMELRDVLWPNSCVVVSFKRAVRTAGIPLIAEGDTVTVHYTTYDPAATATELIALCGEQSDEVMRLMTP